MIQRMSCCFSIAAFVQTIMRDYCSVKYGIMDPAGQTAFHTITHMHMKQTGFNQTEATMTLSESLSPCVAETLTQWD